jgi:hypothetical protein
LTPQLSWRGIVQLDSTGAALQRVAGDRDSDGQVVLAGLTNRPSLSYACLDAAGVPQAAIQLWGAMRETHAGHVLTVSRCTPRCSPPELPMERCTCGT